MKRLSLKVKKGDIFLLIFLGLLSLLIQFSFQHFVGKSEGGNVVIYQEGEKIGEYSLSEDQEITVKHHYTNTVTIENGSAWISTSDCPGADCVHSGAISQKGRNIVCLPNLVEIRIEGESEVDFIVR